MFLPSTVLHSAQNRLRTSVNPVGSVPRWFQVLAAGWAQVVLVTLLLPIFLLCSTGTCRFGPLEPNERCHQYHPFHSAEWKPGGTEEAARSVTVWVEQENTKWWRNKVTWTFIRTFCWSDLKMIRTIRSHLDISSHFVLGSAQPAPVLIVACLFTNHIMQVKRRMCSFGFWVLFSVWNLVVGTLVLLFAACMLT